VPKRRNNTVFSRRSSICQNYPPHYAAHYEAVLIPTHQNAQSRSLTATRKDARTCQNIKQKSRFVGANEGTKNENALSN